MIGQKLHWLQRQYDEKQVTIPFSSLVAVMLIGVSNDCNFSKMAYKNIT